MVSRGAIVFGGALLTPGRRLLRRLARLPDPYVIAADSGAALALACGYSPHLVVGDLDSIDADTLALLEAQLIPRERHPRDKDATDGELAIESALAQSPGQVLLVGFLGGERLDHAIASVLLLQRLPSVRVCLLDAFNECRLLLAGDRLAWTAERSEIVSLLPLNGLGARLKTRGLQWELDDQVLSTGSTRGVSNRPVEKRVTVAVLEGSVLVTRYLPA